MSVHSQQLHAQDRRRLRATATTAAVCVVATLLAVFTALALTALRGPLADGAESALVLDKHQRAAEAHGAQTAPPDAPSAPDEPQRRPRRQHLVHFEADGESAAFSRAHAAACIDSVRHAALHWHQCVDERRSTETRARWAAKNKCGLRHLRSEADGGIDFDFAAQSALLDTVVTFVGMQVDFVVWHHAVQQFAKRFGFGPAELEGLEGLARAVMRNNAALEGGPARDPSSLHLLPNPAPPNQAHRALTRVALLSRRIEWAELMGVVLQRLPAEARAADAGRFRIAVGVAPSLARIAEPLTGSWLRAGGDAAAAVQHRRGVRAYFANASRHVVVLSTGVSTAISLVTQMPPEVAETVLGGGASAKRLVDAHFLRHVDRFLLRIVLGRLLDDAGDDDDNGAANSGDQARSADLVAVLLESIDCGAVHARENPVVGRARGGVSRDAAPLLPFGLTTGNCNRVEAVLQALNGALLERLAPLVFDPFFPLPPEGGGGGGSTPNWRHQPQRRRHPGRQQPPPPWLGPFATLTESEQLALKRRILLVAPLRCGVDDLHLANVEHPHCTTDGVRLVPRLAQLRFSLLANVILRWDSCTTDTQIPDEVEEEENR